MARVSAATKSQHRQRLLEAAAAEFAARGLDGARVDDISLAAGLAKGTIYNYFDSKLDVFRAVVEEWARRTTEARRDVPQSASIREQLMAIATADVGVTGEMEEFARTAFREVLTAVPDVVDQIMPAWVSVDAEIEELILLAQNRGDLRADRSSAELARVFLTLVNGLLLEHWLPGSEIELDDIPKLAVDYYLEGVNPRRAD